MEALMRPRQNPVKEASPREEKASFENSAVLSRRDIDGNRGDELAQGEEQKEEIPNILNGGQNGKVLKDSSKLLEMSVMEDKAVQVSTEVVRQPLINLMNLDDSTREFLVANEIFIKLMESQSRFSHY